ncbi:hypothetical protein EOC94_33125, partial [Mesorhizobium sp. M6A.T.Ce.TU.016.01.1.1]
MLLGLCRCSAALPIEVLHNPDSQFNIPGLQFAFFGQMPTNSQSMKILIVVMPNFNLAATMAFVDPFRAANY